MILYLLIQKERSRPGENTEIHPITCNKIFCDKAGVIKMKVKSSIIL